MISGGNNSRNSSLWATLGHCRIKRSALMISPKPNFPRALVAGGSRWVEVGRMRCSIYDGSGHNYLLQFIISKHCAGLSGSLSVTI